MQDTDAKKDWLFKKIHDLEEKAKKLEQEYEESIKGGNLEKECPYSEITRIYDEIRQEIVNSDA